MIIAGILAKRGFANEAVPQMARDGDLSLGVLHATARCKMRRVSFKPHVSRAFVV